MDMASIRKEMLIEARPEVIWDAVRDVGALHTRLVPGFVTDCRLDGDARIVTFANGLVARELIVDIDDAGRSLVWSVVQGRPTHHNGALQVFCEEGGRSRVVWVADILPHDLAGPIGTMMDQGLRAMKQAMEAVERAETTA
jgi:Polyketide cyclase / dehydrase and lipid transport